MDNNNYKTKTSLILPFKGIWIVGNGGRDPEKNNHYDSTPDQHYAYDFIRFSKDNAKQLRDYEAFNAEVLAPADGTVSQVLNGSIDVQIGETDVDVTPGNMVIIDHKNGEWSMLCHLKHNSIRVQEGNEVKQGDILGRCGNTGNTSEPHVHYQLQDHCLLIKAKGLPAQFSKILVNGEMKENVELERDQKVANLD